MSIVLRIGEREIAEAELTPLLARYRLLPQLAREIIVDRAIAQIECTPEAAEQARQRFYQQEQIASEEQLQVWMKKQGMTAEQLEALMLRDTKLDQFVEETWGSKVESYFLQSKGQLDRVVYSLIRTKDAGITQELYFRIQEGESNFTELAQQYSEGPEAQTGGLIGPVELNVPHQKIAQILTTSQPGQLHPPIPIGEWWILLRLEKYQSAQLDEPTRRRLLLDLFQKWLTEQMEQVSYISEVENKYDS
jgi:parvulin-like peptidyl-prolyl isomerase